MASDNEQMNESRDTIVDVLAEYRSDADAMDRGWLYPPTTEYVRRLLDRIEAAWKRQEQCYLDQIRDAVNMIGHERFVKEHPPIGNAAAMRDALENAYSLLCEGIATEVDDELKHPFHLELACEKIQNALSAPPRNCDLYDSQPKMSEAYESYRKAAMKKYGDGLVGGVPTIKQKPMTYDEWLFAPATERKGDGDGR